MLTSGEFKGVAVYMATRVLRDVQTLDPYTQASIFIEYIKNQIPALTDLIPVLDEFSPSRWTPRHWHYRFPQQYLFCT
jgi:hypothetical protein